MDDLNKRKEELNLLSKKIEAMNADLSQVPDDAGIDVLLACRQKAKDLLIRYAETVKDINKLELEAEKKRCERNKALYGAEKEKHAAHKRELEVVNSLKEQAENNVKRIRNTLIYNKLH